jgi:hypothetical protein
MVRIQEEMTHQLDTRLLRQQNQLRKTWRSSHFNLVALAVEDGT